jgi:hypothetical protein
MTRTARSCIPQSQATAARPEPSVRGTIFQPVPLHSEQFSSGIGSLSLDGERKLPKPQHTSVQLARQAVCFGKTVEGKIRVTVGTGVENLF